VVEYNPAMEEVAIMFDDGTQEHVRLQEWEWRLWAPMRRHIITHKRAVENGARRALELPSVSKAPSAMKPAATPACKQGMAKKSSGSARPSVHGKVVTHEAASMVDGAWEWCGPAIRSREGRIEYCAFITSSGITIRSGDFVMIGNNPRQIGRVSSGFMGHDHTKYIEYDEYIEASATLFAAEKPKSEVFLAVTGDLDAEAPVSSQVEISKITHRVQVEYVPAGAPAPTVEGLGSDCFFCRHSFNTARQRVTGM